jgi:hypothetical protein
MSAVASNNESKSDITPFWIQRGPKEDHESYLRRNLKLKDARKQSVLFRFGSGITLGFPEATQDPCAPKERMHFAHGIPTVKISLTWHDGAKPGAFLQKHRVMLRTVPLGSMKSFMTMKTPIPGPFLFMLQSGRKTDQLHGFKFVVPNMSVLWGCFSPTTT